MMVVAYLVAYGPLGLLGIGVLLLGLRIRQDWRENIQARELLRLIDRHQHAQAAPVVVLDLYRARRRDNEPGGAA